jgi:pilin isopeptide linkage protein
MIQNFMAGWSGGVEFCLWQGILLALVVVAVATIVLMIIFKWNPIQWFGWILAAASLVLLLHTGIFGMNEFAGPIAEDIRLADTKLQDKDMEAAAIYYRDMAMALSEEVSRDANGNVQEGGTVLKARNFTDGHFSFPALTFTEVGTYYYTVSEMPATGDPHGITYDTTTFTVTITVTDNLEGQLVASAKISGNGKITFTNVYTPNPTDVVIPGSKTLNGKVLGIGDFRFQLFAADESWAKGDLIETVENGDGGSFTFSTLHFDAPGTYYYLVQEYNGGKTIDGVTYDDRVYHVTITVTDDLRGHLNAAVTIHDEQGIPYDQIVFVNIYVVKGEAEVQLEGTKTLEGATLVDGAFTFQLFTADEDFAIAGDPIQTATNQSGKFSMTLAYTEADVGYTYYYVVREQFAGQTINGMVYSDQVYYIAVKIVDDGKGGIQALSAIYNGKEVVTSMDFVNTYEEPGNPGTGDHGIVLWLGLLTVSAMALCALDLFRKTRKIQ